MIVKISDGREAWVYLEARRVTMSNRRHAFKNVEDPKDGLPTLVLFRVTGWNKTEPSFDEGDHYFDEMFLSAATYEDLESGKDGYALASVITVWSSEPTPKIYAVVGEVFLMNDQGKTIDRL